MSALTDIVGAFRDAVEQLTARIRVLEANDRAEVAGGVQPVVFADLPAAGQPGRDRFVLDGCKTGELPGFGTGVRAYDDGTTWLRFADDTAVTA